MTRRAASGLRYLRFRRAQIDAAIRALESLQHLRSARSWRFPAIPIASRRCAEERILGIR
jgi:hypothetical protein